MFKNIHEVIDKMICLGFEFNCGKHYPNPNSSWPDGEGYWAGFYKVPTDLESNEEANHFRDNLNYRDFGHSMCLADAILEAYTIAIKKEPIDV